jgi:DNA-directed RNA polymerase subunit M/transcription elongation factor TFIIS
MRICKTCKNELPDERFGLTKKADKSGVVREYRDSTCMVCRRNKYLAKEGKREIHRQGSKSWYERNPEKAKSQRLKKYGIDLEGYNKLRKKQKFCCSICGKKETDVAQGRAKSSETALAVDHSHETGKIRGLLCIGCNTILGKCYDDVSILKRAVKYLQEEL